MTTTVRISEETKKVLASIASRKGISQQAVLAEAVEEYRRKLHWEQFNEAYSALRSDRRSLAEEKSERGLWDATLADGLEKE